MQTPNIRNINLEHLWSLNNQQFILPKIAYSETNDYFIIIYQNTAGPLTHFYSPGITTTPKNSWKQFGLIKCSFDQITQWYAVTVQIYDTVLNGQRLQSGVQNWTFTSTKI